MKWLRITAGAVSLIAVLSAACTQADANPSSPSAQAPSGPLALRGTVWSLVELNGKALTTPTGQKAPTLQLATSGGRASGFGGCNQWSATYTTSDDTVRLTGMIMTRMFCVDRMDLEKEYTTALESVSTYRLKDTRLELLAKDKVVAAFQQR
jgi:heat shock protein HslJ